MTEETPIKAKPAKRKFLLIRYGRMNILGLFEHTESEIPRTLTRVVVKTDKGLELGHLVGQLDYYKDGRFRLSEEQIASYYTTSEIQFNTEPVGKVVRIATPDDISEEQHLKAITAEEIASCERLADELGLRMKIIDAEHIFGGERIVFYFMAEGRVDFRELVRKLAQEYQTRIEMRQIGSRDEAKLLGDVESCGRECCCLQFLQLLKPVNMRMAKMQKATLDPSKISGYCGRLKCCLRYEDQTYTDLKQSLPKRGVLVQTEKGEGKVIDGQILTQLVIVEFPNGEKASFPVDEITVLPASAIKRKPQEESAPDANRRPENGERPPAREPQRRPSRDQRRPPRNEHIEGFDEQQEDQEEPQDVREERPEAAEGQSVDPDQGREDSGQESADVNRRPENANRPPARDSQRRPGRDQRRPPRNERREGFDEQREDREKPQDVRDERPEVVEGQSVDSDQGREDSGQESAEMNRRPENANRPPARDSQRRPGRDQRRPPRNERREGFDEQREDREKPQDVCDERPEAVEGQSVDSDQGREDSGQESRDKNRRSENANRPPARDSQRRPGRDQRRPSRNGRREAFDRKPETRDEPQEVRDEQPEAPKEPQVNLDQGRENPDEEVPDATESVEGLDKQQ